jgi:hypothetical protein
MSGFFRRLAEPAAAPDRTHIRPLTTTYSRSLDLVDDESLSVRVPEAPVARLHRNSTSSEPERSREIGSPAPALAFEQAGRAGSSWRPLDEVEEPTIPHPSSGPLTAPPSESDAPAPAVGVVGRQRAQVASTNVREDQHSQGDTSSLGSPSKASEHERPLTAKAGAPSTRFVAAVREQPLPDVHIHIGRIELTGPAPQASTSLRRSPAAVVPAMPLDEYLRRRNRKGR